MTEEIKKYNKKYYEEHKKYFQDYYKENKGYYEDYYKEHKEYFRNYYKTYYEKHKEKILETARLWRLENSVDIIYFHIDENGQTIYIGSSGKRPIVERQSFHLLGYSNLKMTINEYIEKYKFSVILYKDFTRFNLNREDLYFIESYFKTNYKEILGGNKVNYKEDELSKSKEELIEIAENEEYREFEKLDRYLN